jgi:hypothetical protein
MWPRQDEPRRVMAALGEHPCVRTARVRDLLVALPRIGAVRAGRILVWGA